MSHYRPHLDPASSHGQITRLVRALGRGPVLDVGAAQGILGQMLADARLPIDAIEPHADWAHAARPHYRQVYNCSIESANGLPEKSYHVVICGDVLEHTVDPLSALRKLKAYAAPDAAFIISLPNVAHIAIRLMLLLGFFPRMERGTLDKTHLHFFTRKTARQMIEQAGLRVERISATPVPLEEIWSRGRGNVFFGLLMGIQKLFVRLLPRLFGYQWVFVARGTGP